MNIRHFVFTLMMFPPTKSFQNLISFYAGYQFRVSQLQIHPEGTVLLLSTCTISKPGGYENIQWCSAHNPRIHGSPGNLTLAQAGDHLPSTFPTQQPTHAPGILPTLGPLMPPACPDTQSPAPASLNLGEASCLPSDCPPTPVRANQ